MRPVSRWRNWLRQSIDQHLIRWRQHAFDESRLGALQDEVDVQQHVTEALRSSRDLGAHRLHRRVVDVELGRRSLEMKILEQLTLPQQSRRLWCCP